MASLTMYFMFLVCCYEACHYHRPSDDGRLRNSCKAVPSPTQTITTYPTSPSSSPSQYDESHFFRENVKSPPPSPPHRCCITGHRGRHNDRHYHCHHDYHHDHFCVTSGILAITQSPIMRRVQYFQPS